MTADPTIPDSDRHDELDHAALDARYPLLPRTHRAGSLAPWLVTHVNGRSGSRLGRARARPAASIETAHLELAHMLNDADYAATN